MGAFRNKRALPSLPKHNFKNVIDGQKMNRCQWVPAVRCPGPGENGSGVAMRESVRGKEGPQGGPLRTGALAPLPGLLGLLL